MNRIGYLLSLSLLIQTVALGVSFAECHTEEEAIDWLKEKLSTNEKIDKNIISIVRLEKNVHVKAVVVDSVGTYRNCSKRTRS